MRRILPALVIAACFTTPAAAQQQQEQKPAQRQDTTMAAGVLAGQAAAQAKGTGGSFWGGFVGGMAPPWGYIVAYVVQGPARPSPMQIVELGTHNSAYVLGFQEGFNERSRAMKKSAALKGGLIGTLTISVMFILAYASESGY